MQFILRDTHTFYFDMILDFQVSCKNSIEFLYKLHPTLSSVTFLHNHDSGTIFDPTILPLWSVVMLNICLVCPSGPHSIFYTLLHDTGGGTRYISSSVGSLFPFGFWLGSTNESSRKLDGRVFISIPTSPWLSLQERSHYQRPHKSPCPFRPRNGNISLLSLVPGCFVIPRFRFLWTLPTPFKQSLY